MDNAIAPPSDGSKMHFGPVAGVDDNLATLEALTYQEIAEIVDIGEFGKEFQINNYESLGRRRILKRKGTYNSGDPQFTMGHDQVNDDGQIALKAAADSDNNYAVKIELNDAPEGGTPTTFYFVGLVTRFRPNIGGPNNHVRSLATIAINSDVLVDPAAEASP